MAGGRGEAAEGGCCEKRTKINRRAGKCVGVRARLKITGVGTGFMGGERR